VADSQRRLFIAGNWKMNKNSAEAVSLARELRTVLAEVRGKVEVAIAPPFTALHPVYKAIEDSNIFLAGQNCHWESSGAFTGEISAPMLKELGCAYVIVGHSERRQLFGETDETVNKRVSAAVQASMMPIICVGETLTQRDAGKTLEVVTGQVRAALQGFQPGEVSRFVIAYEPVWAIGTGRTATSAQAQEVHAHIRELVNQLFGRETGLAVRIQYGGSVKPENAAELLGQPDIDGALVGGASLKATDFAAIIKAKL
jgi:triosephosphate isomerase